MLERIAIVNRGEPAMRLIHAVRELDHQLGQQQGRSHGVGLTTIALHTHAERGAMFVREADEAVRIGPGPGEPPAATNPYLDHDELCRALIEARAEAAWVGWGFVAEHADFSDRCEALDVTFVGPSGDVMRKLGDKIGSKLLAEEAGVPVAPWSGGAVADVDEAREHAERIGYPLLIKASAGGGGRGIRRVESDDELATAFERASAEAGRSFGDPTVFLEQAVADARHVEVQIVADGHGGVWALGTRDCSVQRRNQKVLEESASTALDPDEVAEIQQAASELARRADYRGAGTVEFLYQPSERRFAFLEVNTRLQVEHPVTELCTGADLVKLQLHVANGGRLEGDPPPARGHAIEVRLNAEDPERGFSPAPGTIAALTLPTGPGVRVDTGVAEGDVIPPDYDSMIAKIIAWGSDRSEAAGRLGRALAQTTVLVDGGTTNRAFLLDLLRHPDVIAGEVTTRWLDGLTADGGYVFTTRPEVALVAAGIDAYDTASALERTRFLASAARGRPQASDELTRTVDLRLGGVAYRLEVACTGPGRYLVAAEGQRVLAEVEHLGKVDRRLTVGGRRHRVVSITQGADQLVEVDGVPHRVSQDDAGLVRAPGPSVVVAITAAEGDRVEAGASVAVLESMKMETVLAAPFTGRVKEVLVTGNVQLDAGAPVVRLEPDEDEDAASDTGPRADLATLATEDDGPDRPFDRALAAVDGLRRLVLGFDVPSDAVPALVDDLGAAEDDEELLRAELDVLSIFADLTSLTRNRRIGDDEDRDQAHSAREYLHAYLRSLDAQGEGLPDTFVSRLQRALAHHGVDDLDRTPQLEEALFRIHLAQQRTAEQLPGVLALLDRRLAAGAAPEGELAEQLRDTLDRLVRATQVRHPVIGDLARRARYRAFDQPRLEQERARVLGQAREHLEALAADPGRDDREERITAMIDASEPLLGLLEDPAVVEGGLTPLLEVLTRRYYRTRDVGPVRSVEVAGRPAVVADVSDARGPGRVVAISVPHDELTAALADAAQQADDLPADAGAGAVADVYVTWRTPPADADELAEDLAERLAAAEVSEVFRRVTLSVTSAGHDGADRSTAAASPSLAGTGNGTAGASVTHLTFRRNRTGYVERRHLRGIHPLIAGRLELWRFERFEVTRLPSTDGVYLFDLVGRDAPTDRRLMALAEVRDLTVARDGDGRVVALPELERVLSACLDDLRSARANRPPNRRPDWNRVLLHVWPPVDVEVREFDQVVRALAPLTDGLGLEQVMVQARFCAPDGAVHPAVVRMSRPPGQGLTLRVTPPPTEPLKPLDEVTAKVLRARRRGTVYPYELVPLVAGPPGTARLTNPTQLPVDGPALDAEGAGVRGRFVEQDLDVDGRLVPVERPPGGNTASIVVGVVSTPTERYPEGMTRVVLLGDPTKGLGSLAEAECARVIAALDLAEDLQVPVEWFAVSSGARIAMDSGTENMDWIGRALKRIVTFTQAGGEINVIVSGINVGAQPYWNAEATMLMHTKGILVMTPDSAMVLTGKQALDYSGGVSAEDNFGIGGYDRVMGPNGQAQHWAPDLASAIELLFRHYEHSYVAPGERFPRPAPTDDPRERDVRDAPHEGPGSDFTTVGEIFAEASNPGRKKPFDVRSVLRAVADADHEPLERWRDLADGEVAVVQDAHLGGHPVTLLGIESRVLPRRGLVPADGPDSWSAGTLFPKASKKVARAINAASGTRPLVVLANLSGFDGSPESLRELQLEYGAEIGRAIVNFDGPIVFCVISRYHGGAFVVFSQTLNDHMEVAALEGAHASVIGGPPAAAVVFAREVDNRTDADPRVADLEQRIAEADGSDELGKLQAEVASVRASVRSEKLGEMAKEFDAVHSVERALAVGSIDQIVAPDRLRPYLIDAVERGMTRITDGG